jgi:hypothetical protein
MLHFRIPLCLHGASSRQPRKPAQALVIGGLMCTDVYQRASAQGAVQGAANQKKQKKTTYVRALFGLGLVTRLG